MTMVPIAGLAPDSDPNTPGIFLDCTNVIPYDSGFQGAPAPVAVAAAALAAECRGAVVATKLDGTRRILAGTQTDLYELTSTTWTNRSAAGSYVGSSETRWSFCQFGDTTIASNLTDPMQSSVSGGFLPVGGPMSGVVVTAGGSGYTSAPAVTFGGFGTGATATAVLTGAVVTSVNITAAGTGYSPSSTVIFTGGGGTGATATVTAVAAPKAKIVVSASSNFVIAFNTNDPVYGQSPDRWWCCAQSDQTNWNPSVTTSANTGRLVAVEGAIQAAKTLGDYVVVYKQRAVFVGVFAGAPVVWQFNLIPGGECGAVGPEAVCDIGGAHFVVGNDNFWIFDGTRPQPIGTGVIRQTFLNSSSPLYRYRTKAIFDKQNNLVHVNYPSNVSTGACDATLVYHVAAKKWGRNDVVAEAPLNFIAPGVTIDGLNAYAATIDTLPNIPLDSQYWLSGGQTPAYFNGSHQLVSLTGACGASSITTGDMGDDDTLSVLDQFRMRYVISPTTATATGLAKMNEGDAFYAGATNAINDGKFDMRQSGRFHRVRIDMTGDHKETAYAGKPKPVAQR